MIFFDFWGKILMIEERERKLGKRLIVEIPLGWVGEKDFLPTWRYFSSVWEVNVSKMKTTRNPHKMCFLNLIR